jgi:myo-inositol-1(or 4)-monophosphatase
MPHSATLNVMIKAAYRAGRSLKRDLGEVENLQVSLKGPRNFVTAADRRAEDIVREELLKARPDYGFLGEEGGARAGADKTHRWIVDPLDGTTNFLHGIPHFAVSIALERGGAIVAALTYNPANDDLFVAERGKGAFLNDRRIRVAARQKLADAVVACGLPHYGRGDLALGRHEIAAAQAHYAGLRRFGAASLDLAWVAAGRFDAYWERNLAPWDLAAGILLVREAGGFVSDLDGGDAILAKGHVAAGNDTMHRELLRLLKEASKAAAKESAQGSAQGPAQGSVEGSVQGSAEESSKEPKTAGGEDAGKGGAGVSASAARRAR